MHSMTATALAASSAGSTSIAAMGPATAHLDLSFSAAARAAAPAQPDLLTRTEESGTPKGDMPTSPASRPHADLVLTPETLPLSSVWWRVLMEMSEDAWLFLAAMASSVIAAIAGVRAAQHIGLTFDIMAEGGDPASALAPAVASLVAVYAVRAIFTFISATLLSMGVNRLSTRLQTQLVRSLLEQDIAFFDGEARGALSQAVSADVKEATAALKHMLQNGLQMLTAVLGGAYSLFALSRRLSLVMLTAIPVTTVVFRQFGSYIRALSRQERTATARAASIVDESVANIRTVQSFVAEGLEAERFATDVRSALSLRHSLGMLRGAFFGLLTFALHGVTAVVVAVGGTFVSRGEMTHGDVSAFLAQTREVIQAFGGMTRLADEAREGAIAMRRVVELIEREPNLLVRRPATHARGGVEGESAAQVGGEADARASAGASEGGGSEEVRARPRGHVVFRGVRFAYPRRPDAEVLRGLDLELEAGKVTALVGDSGSGKTTVAWLLERFYDPIAGEILLDGEPLCSHDVRWLRRQIGLVSQEPVLFATSVGNNIRYGRPGASEAELQAAAVAAHAHTFISKFDEAYDKPLGAGGAGLSGGQKQRVAIARALVKDPAILILDEATSALDAHSEAVVLDALDSEGLLADRTTLVIAHRLSTVKRADKIAVLKEGRVVEQGTHTELIAKGGVYASLVRLQLSPEEMSQ